MADRRPTTDADTFVELLGIEFPESDGETALARVQVGPHLLQPYGIVHGGVHAALSETVCSYATALGVGAEGKIAIGQSNSTTFLRPVTAGYLNAAATPRHRGRTSWVWDVEITDDEGRLCAVSRLIIAVRPQPSQPR